MGRGVVQSAAAAAGCVASLLAFGATTTRIPCGPVGYGCRLPVFRGLLVGLLESVAGVVVWESSSLRQAPSSVRFGRLFGSASAVEQNGYPLGSLSSCAHIAACVVDPAFVGWFGYAAASSGLRGAWCSFWVVCLVSSLARGRSVSS